MRFSRSVPPELTASLSGWRFAHRGRHGPEAVENGRAAFRAAITAGEGIECDVRLSADGVAFIFHDATLDRLAGQAGEVAALTARQLEAVRLANGGETIPRLSEGLALVAGRVPLLLELKVDARGCAPLCAAVAKALEAYQGTVGVMSFDPGVARWFSDHAPGWPRGLVSSLEGRGRWLARLGRWLAACRADPDFLALDIRDLPSAFAARWRARGRVLLCWTVRGAAAEAVAAACADAPIYEEAGG